MAVIVQHEADDRPPLGAHRLADEPHVRLVREAVRLARIALDARAHDVLPRGLAAVVARDDVVEVQLLAGEGVAAILAMIGVAFEDVVARQLQFLAGQLVEEGQQNDARQPDPAVDGAHGLERFDRRIVTREIDPIHQRVGVECLLGLVDDLRVFAGQQGEGAARPNDVHRLPEAVQHEHRLIECSFHK